MVDDISKLYAKILEEQNEKDSEASIVENHLIEENESQISDSFPKEEPFDNFLLKLSEKIAEHLDISEDVEDNQNEEVENNYGGVPLEKQTTKSSYIEELKKMDKGDKSKLLNKNDNISATISEQVKEEIGKVKTQISRMAIEGGGGSVAVQYAKGGVMNGDLNVTGKYLSGGIDLSTLIGSGGSGGGGLSGTTDRLVSGTEVFKLNTDGTFNFPNNIITPQDEVILTLEATKVLDGYYNRLALSPHGFFASDHNGNSITIDSTDNEILIDSNNTYFWKFNNQGALEGPFGTLSVSGNLSATNVVYASGGNSDLWNSTFTTVYSNSANWQGLYTTVQTNSSTWVNSPLSADKWNSVYSSVQTNSATWNAGSVGPYQATYYKSANQNLTNGSTDITFDLDAAWNNDNGYITHTSGSSNFTVVQAGVYQLEWNTSINANGASWNNSLNKTISINITRSPELEQLVIGQSALMAPGQNYSQSICSTIKLEVGDVINLQTFLAFSTATPFVQGVLNTYDLNTWFYWRFISQ